MLVLDKDDPRKTKVVANDGRRAEIHAVKKGQKYPLLGAIQEVGGDWRQVSWTMEGRAVINYENYVANIINAPEPPVTIYINFYGNGLPCGQHSTRAKADHWACSSRIACVKITYVPGVFDV
jgi:hypothetical protein